MTNANNSLWLHSQCKGVLTTVDAIKSKAITIGALSRASSSGKAQGFIELELLKLNARLNLKNPLTEFDVEFIAEDIVNRYKNLNIADISLIFDNMCRGKYGEFYERINSAKILSIIDHYWDERLEEAARMKQEEHDKIKHSKIGQDAIDQMGVKEFYEKMARDRSIEEERQKAKRKDKSFTIAAHNEYLKITHKL